MCISIRTLAICGFPLHVQDKSEITSSADLKRNGPSLDDLNRCYRVHSWPGADPATLSVAFALPRQS